MSRSTRKVRLMKRVTVAVVSSLIAMVSVVGGFSVTPAFADPIDDQMNEMGLRYGSLSSAMLDSYAHKEGKALTSFLIGNPGQLANLSGLSSSDPRVQTLLSQVGPGATMSELDAALAASGLTLSSTAYRSVSAAAREVSTKGASMDAAVVAAGMSWASKMVNLRAPELVVPTAPGLDVSEVTGMPAEGLAFGMFTNRSLNAFVRQFPDVFSQVSTAGIGSASQQNAWNSAMTTAMNASRPDFNSMLPSQCGAAFLAGLSGGGYSGSCSPCVAAGRLANGQLQLIFDPSASSVIPNPSDPSLSPTEWANLTPAQRAAITAQNPSVSGAISSSNGGGSTGCSAGSGAVQRNVSQTVPSILDFLGGR